MIFDFAYIIDKEQNPNDSGQHILSLKSEKFSIRFLLKDRSPVATNNWPKVHYFYNEFPGISRKVLTGKRKYKIKKIKILDSYKLHSISKTGNLFHWDLSFIKCQILKKANVSTDGNENYHFNSLAIADMRLIQDMTYYVLTPKKHSSLIIMPKFKSTDYIDTLSVDGYLLDAYPKQISKIVSSIIASKTGNSV